MQNIEKLVPDTSIIIEGLLSKKIQNNEISAQTVLIHEAVLGELEHQANQNKAIGYLGLEELQKLRKLAQDGNFELLFSGTKLRAAEIRYAHLGEIDSLIRDLAFEQGATLITADKIQARIAEIKGLSVIYIKFEQTQKKIKLEEFFDESTMSVHLRENTSPMAKKGFPGQWDFIKIRDALLTRDEIQDISREIIEEAGIRRDGFVEIERPGSTIVQLGLFRIVITKPPFSDGWEITAVRPVKKMSIDDYKLSEKLTLRIAEQAEGILIAGAPGMGKSTFAQALAIYYASKNKVVKTVEAPRDLILPDNITQYAISHGDAQEIHDILLLSRPDYTIFDEMRNTGDFKLFADLRLAGIGLAGVVHATNPIDAIQRFVGRIELGVIPQIIDTVIFIKDGFVNKVLNLNMTVKVPEGMTEADLARPVVVVTDFETKKLEYELYSYGEETVVIPVRSSGKKPHLELAEKSVEQELLKYVSRASVEFISDNKCIAYIPEAEIGYLIGKKGKTIDKIEGDLGISIDVQAEKEQGAVTVDSKNIAFNTSQTKKHVVILVDKIFANKNVSIYLDEDYLMTVNVGKEGVIKITKKNKIGKLLQDAIQSKGNIKLVQV
jgi:ATPase